ncbi:winged helix-turn-helix domain-containing protein [Actinospica sp.]|uniref:ArsR/SmtB family transcription factor n=1 Tax=Actinospica sp. TaxID=1872142 RepID=UPI002CDDAEEF|nr:winged helix-turn-helix domain-containing protein [Actinospica sp.]HWG23588.1 winged helix-turn-helix domain-containing protein [Actinospica sp.]
MRIRFSTQDFGHIRFATRPAPLFELNLALLNLARVDGDPLTVRWRRLQSHALLHALPSALPLRDLIEEVRRGGAEAWDRPSVAQRRAFDAVLAPRWQVVEDLHRGEFTRHALAVAEYGIAHALAALPHAHLDGDTLEIDCFRADERRHEHKARDQDRVRDRDIVLLPHFHGAAHTYVTRAAERPLVIAYPAGPGAALLGEAAQQTDQALADVIGHTRHRALLLLTEAHTTGDLARSLKISNATASAHATSLRAAGLIASTRTGRTVLHQCTALGELLIQHRRARTTAVA